MNERVAEWYEQYSAALLGYVRHLTGGHADAEDICMQVWLAAMRCSDANLERGWFFAVARCRVLDWYKHERVVARAAIEPSHTPPFEDRVIESIELSEVWQAAVMTDMQRRAIWLHAMKGYPAKDIAGQLNTTYAGAKALLHRARCALCEARL